MNPKTQSVCKHCQQSIKPCGRNHGPAQLCKGVLHESNYHVCQDTALKAADSRRVAEPASTGEPPPFKSDNPWHLFHHLWTKAVGSAGYVKQEWRDLESVLVRAKVAARPSEPSAKKMFNFGGLIDAFDLLPNDVAEQIEVLGSQINELRKWVEEYFYPDSEPSAPLQDLRNHLACDGCGREKYFAGNKKWRHSHSNIEMCDDEDCKKFEKRPSAPQPDTANCQYGRSCEKHGVIHDDTGDANNNIPAPQASPKEVAEQSAEPGKGDCINCTIDEPCSKHDVASPQPMLCLHCHNTRWKVIAGDGCAVQDRTIPCPYCTPQPVSGDAPNTVRCTNCGMYGFFVHHDSVLGGLVLKCVDCGEQKLIEDQAGDAPKLKEIAWEFIAHVFPSMDRQQAQRFIEQGAAILRPYFPPASQTPDLPSEEEIINLVGDGWKGFVLSDVSDFIFLLGKIRLAIMKHNALATPASTRTDGLSLHKLCHLLNEESKNVMGTHYEQWASGLQRAITLIETGIEGGYVAAKEIASPAAPGSVPPLCNDPDCGDCYDKREALEHSQKGVPQAEPPKEEKP